MIEIGGFTRRRCGYPARSRADISWEVEMTEPDPNPIYTSLAEELGTADPEVTGEPADDQERPASSTSTD